MTKTIKLSALILVSGIIFAGCATTAQSESAQTSTTKETSAQTTKVASVASEKDGDRKVCKRVVPTGSRFAVKDCRTADEWEALREQAKRGSADQQRRSAGIGNAKGG